MLWQTLRSSYRQGGHFTEFSTESLIVANAKDIGVLIRLLYMTPDDANDIFIVLHISKQDKWATEREVWPIQDVPSWMGVMSKAIIHPLYIHMFDGCDTRVRPCGMSKVMNNLILGECVHTFTDINSTQKDVVEADPFMKFLTDGNDIDD